MKKTYQWLFISSLLLVVPVHAQQPSAIELRGPDTLILFGQKINEFYQHKQPGRVIRTQGGGVQSAIAQLMKGQIDIVQSHGELRPELAKGLVPLSIGVEAIVFYVKPSNPVNELSLAQVRAIYTGEILNWKQLGGPDERIAIYGADSTSSMNPYFAEFVLRGDTSFSYMGKGSTKELLDTVATHPEAIGFAGLGFSPHVKAIRIRAATGSKAVAPTFDSIRSLDYPFTRSVIWYLARQPGGNLRSFCEWMLSSEGQLVVEEVGFQPLSLEKRLVARQRLGLPAMPDGAGSYSAN